MTLQELVFTAFEDVRERDGGEVYVDCCFCDDGKSRLGVNVLTGVMHCFHCDEVSGDRSSTYKSKKKTYEKIAAAVGVDEPFELEEGEQDVSVEERQQETKQKLQAQQELPNAFEPLWRNVNDRVGREAFRYLIRRGVKKDQIRSHKIGFCAAGRYAYRIVFPVYYRKRLQGFVCRDFTGDAELKYLNSDGDKGLYNLPAASKRRRRAILVEGVFDVLAVERAGLEKYDKIGGLGSKLKPSLYRKLSTYNKVCIWAEPDPAGVEGTIQRAKELQRRGVKVYVVLPEQDIEADTDPGDMLSGEIRERIKNAVPYSTSVAARMRTRIAFSSKRKVPKDDRSRSKSRASCSTSTSENTG